MSLSDLCCRCVPRRDRRALLMLLLCYLPVAGQEAFGAEGRHFVMIVHRDNTVQSASQDFLRRAFLKTSTRWDDGEVLKPVDQRPSARVRVHFSKAVLGRTVAAVKNYWQQRIFSGRGVPPPELASDEAVVRYVAAHRGAVGYVEEDTPLEGVTVLAVK